VDEAVDSSLADPVLMTVSDRERATPPLAIAHFWSQLRVHGTVCHLASPR